MIKLMHAADFHLDAAFASLPPEKAKQRRAEQRQALEAFARACEGCELILLAGDLFDGETAYLDTIEALKSCFNSISGQIFIAPGNHDPLKEDSPYLREDWGENVHIFTEGQLQRIELENCDIYGAAYINGEQDVLQGFHVEDESRINLLVLHTGAQYNPITQEQIEASGLDYLALGHVHSKQVRKYGYTTMAYPGCLMGRGFDECGQKGALRVRVSKVSCDTEFVPIPGRRYEILEVELREDPLTEILNALAVDSEECCLRIVLRGRVEGLDLPALQTALQEHCFSLELVDKTDAKRELWDSVGEDTLRGEVMSELKARLDAADEEEAKRIVFAARLLSDLMDGREVTL